MPLLEISLLGSPQITLDGSPIRIPTSRALPLIAYLALSSKVQTRETVANLLWPDGSQKQALAALRTTLWRLKSVGLDNWIVLDRNEIALNPHKSIEIDVMKFKALLDKCSTHGHPSSQICLFCTPALTEAIELYRGEFMRGFNISKAFTFDDWRMQQSQTLESLFIDALERLVRCHRTFGDFNLAIHYARLWLSVDHLNENAHHQLLQLYLITGQRTAGISLYKYYKDVLKRELGLAPSDDMTTLYRQIVTGHSAPDNKQKVNAPVFLIIDIEKPALYWARTATKKIEVLSNFHNIVKETARHFGGMVLQKSEDNITLLFENGQPSHCAVTIHLKLKKADWGDAGPPNLRMVLYSTNIEGDNRGNFAMLTRIASSLLAISWGGQIVFSEQTLRLLDIPSGSKIKDLGYHLLNDTEGSIHVYELLHPHLPTGEHPPLQTSTQQLVNFPISISPFVGREYEMEELTNLLLASENRLISLVGPGGIGKTRLAVQSASQVINYFSNGVYFISLASIQDPDFLPILLADALKFSFYGPTSHTEQLANYLHGMKVLLVIDNFEHLRIEGAKFLAFILGRTHFLKILVTSRERLNMIAETVVEVHGMPVPESASAENIESYCSIKLFLHNAQRTFPRFDYPNNLEAIINICQLVDGIPLGILLASSWVRVFSCSEIASEIKKNLDFLTTSAPDIDPRHRSLRAVFDNSWKLLSEEERCILRKLSIFQAPFTASASQEICDATPLLLSVLTDKSLLNHRPDNRFEMMTTFHQYASGKLEEIEDELSKIKSKFCDYYSEFCAKKHSELNSTAQRKSLGEMISEIENIRIAWSWMVDSGRWELIEKAKLALLTYHIILGNYIQGEEFFHLALLKLNKLKAPELELMRASMLQLSSWMLVRNGFLTEGLQGLAECLEIFCTYNATWDIAYTKFFMAEANRAIGKLPTAKILIEEALQLMHSDGIQNSSYVSAIIAHCQSIRGTILIDLGDYDQARINLNASLSTHHQLGTGYGTIHPLMGLGKLAYLQGDFLHARDLYLQALDTAINISDQRGIVLIHNNLGAVYEVIVNNSESYYHVITALKLCKETGDRRLTAVILNNLAYQQLRFLDQPAEAIRTYQESIEIFSEIADLRGLAYCTYDISKAYLKVGLLEESWRYCIRSLKTAMILDSVPLILHALHGIANFFANTNQLVRALGLCYLIVNHPQLEPDTQKRVIVTKVVLEAAFPADTIKSARDWGEVTNLQDLISQFLTEKIQ